MQHPRAGYGLRRQRNKKSTIRYGDSWSATHCPLHQRYPMHANQLRSIWQALTLDLACAFTRPRQRCFVEWVTRLDRNSKALSLFLRRASWQ